MKSNRDLQPVAEWLRALRPWTIAYVGFPALLGIVYTEAHGPTSRLNTILLLIAAVLLQFGSNLLREFFRFRRATADESGAGSVFGPSRTRLDWIIFLSGIACFFLSIPFGMILVYRAGLPLLLLGLAAFAAGYFYTAEPVNYKRRGLGVPAAFLFLGPLPALGAAVAVSGRLPPYIVSVSIPPGLLAAALLLAEELVAAERDRAEGVLTLPVRIGRRGAGALFALLMLVAYLWPALLLLLPAGFRPGNGIWLLYALIPVAGVALRQILTARARSGHAAWMLIHHYLFGAVYVSAFAGFMQF
ncbi:UbiA family prenyltransferase [Salinispira pacifica]